MIWKLIFEGRIACKTDGTEVFFNSEVQDWGLSVKDLQIGVLILGRSSAGNAKTRVRIEDGFEADPNGLNNVTEVIAPTIVNPLQLPKQYRGVLAGSGVPYFRSSLGLAANSGAVEESINVRLYAGGKAY